MLKTIFRRLLHTSNYGVKFENNKLSIFPHTYDVYHAITFTAEGINVEIMDLPEEKNILITWGELEAMKIELIKGE